jgi:hypothetical protein
MIIVLKLVSAKCVGLTETAGRETNAASLVNVLIVAVQDALRTQTAVLDITVVRRDNGIMN